MISKTEQTTGPSSVFWFIMHNPTLHTHTKRIFFLIGRKIIFPPPTVFCIYICKHFTFSLSNIFCRSFCPFPLCGASILYFHVIYLYSSQIGIGRSSLEGYTPPPRKYSERICDDKTFFCRFNTKNCTVMSTVTYAMSKTILRHDGMVLPIGEHANWTCRVSWDLFRNLWLW